MQAADCKVELISSVDTLLKTEKYKSVYYFYACVSMTVMSLQLIFMIIRIRRHISMLFYKHTMATEEKGLNWLKLRTIEVECINIVIQLQHLF